jgi:hypothetical protein
MSALVEIHHPHMPPNQGNTTGFQRGHPRYGGRQKGTRNKLGGDVRQEILDGISDVGFIGKDKDGNPIAGEGGIRGVVRWLGLHEPKTAAALLARIMPYYTSAPAPPEIMTCSEIEAQLKELGLPLGLIEYFQKAPVQLDPGEDPDPWGVQAEKEAANANAPAAE